MTDPHQRRLVFCDGCDEVRYVLPVDIQPDGVDYGEHYDCGYWKLIS